MEDRYNATVLDEELRAAGLKIHGCSSTGRIDWVSPPSNADQKKADSILKAHNPIALPSRQEKLEALRQKRRQGKTLNPQDLQEAIDLMLDI